MTQRGAHPIIKKCYLVPFYYSFFQLLTSFCPICSHILKTLNTISTTSVCCDHINTIRVVFTQYSVNYHVSKILTLHLADAFIQSNLQCIQVIHLLYVCFLGIEPTTFCAANTMLHHWATGTLFCFHTSLPKTKIMDPFSLTYKCWNTACQKRRPNVPNLRYSVTLLLLQQQHLKSIEQISLYEIL